MSPCLSISACLCDLYGVSVKCLCLSPSTGTGLCVFSPSVWRSRGLSALLPASDETSPPLCLAPVPLIHKTDFVRTRQGRRRPCTARTPLISRRSFSFLSLPLHACLSVCLVSLVLRVCPVFVCLQIFTARGSLIASCPWTYSRLVCMMWSNEEVSRGRRACASLLPGLPSLALLSSLSLSLPVLQSSSSSPSLGGLACSSLEAFPPLALTLDRRRAAEDREDQARRRVDAEGGEGAWRAVPGMSFEFPSCCRQHSSVCGGSLSDLSVSSPGASSCPLFSLGPLGSSPQYNEENEGSSSLPQSSSAICAWHGL